LEVNALGVLDGIRGFCEAGLGRNIVAGNLAPWAAFCYGAIFFAVPCNFFTIVQECLQLFFIFATKINLMKQKMHTAASECRQQPK